MLPGMEIDEPGPPGGGRRLALARKYRPAKFADVVGQEHVVRALTSSLRSLRLHHAYLLTGTRGTGKTTIARILAKAFNCASGGSEAVAEPCNKCASCTEIAAGSCSDVIELDAASHTQVDRMRELIEGAFYAPASCRYKVYIIDEVHMLSKHSFNAMLKTLEEPPDHAKFILATTDPQMVPATVQSRCLRFALRRLEPALIRARLAEILNSEGVGIEDGALAIIAELADGSLRDALSILDEAISSGETVKEDYVRRLVGLASAETVPKLLAALAAGDADVIRAVCDGMYEQAASFDSALAQLAGILHRVALVKMLPSLAELGGRPDETVTKAAGVFSDGALQALYEIALHARDTLRFAPDPRTGFEMALLRMLVLTRASSAAEPANGNPKQGRGSKEPAAGVPAAVRQRSEPVSAGGVPSLPTNPEQWKNLVENLDVRISSLLNTCAYVSTACGKITLDPGNNRAQIEKERLMLEKKLHDVCQTDCVLELVASGTGRETPMAASLREQNEQREQNLREIRESEEHKLITQAFPDSTVK